QHHGRRRSHAVIAAVVEFVVDVVDHRNGTVGGPRLALEQGEHLVVDLEGVDQPHEEGVNDDGPQLGHRDLEEHPHLGGGIDPGSLVDVLGNGGQAGQDRKSTRLNSSHVSISYAVFCLKKKK